MEKDFGALVSVLQFKCICVLVWMTERESARTSAKLRSSLQINPQIVFERKYCVSKISEGKLWRKKTDDEEKQQLLKTTSTAVPTHHYLSSTQPLWLWVEWISYSSIAMHLNEIQAKQQTCNTFFGRWSSKLHIVSMDVYSPCRCFEMYYYLFSVL